MQKLWQLNGGRNDSMANLESEIRKQRAKNKMLKEQGKPQEVYHLIKENDEHDEPPKGSPTGKCSKCGKEFTQNYSSDRNAYSSFKHCPECRRKLAQKKESKLTQEQREVAVARLPYEPFPWQIEAAKAFETHRFIALSCGNRCLLAGSFVNGVDKPIEEVKRNDKVISKNGELQKVLDTYQEEYDGDIYTIKAIGVEEIRCTDEHPVWIALIDKKAKEVKEEKMVCAKDIQAYIDKNSKSCNAYLKMPRVKGNVKCDYWEFEKYEKNYKNQLDGLPINEDTAWMLGLYCAEGCYLEDSGVKFTLNYKEPELAERLYKLFDSLGIHYNVRERPNEGTRCVVISKMQFCRKVDKEIGHGSTNKKIPPTILYNEDEDILLSFLKGYYAGDGYVNYERRTMSVTTVSRTLSQQLQTAWTRLGHFSKITSFQRESKRRKKNGELGVQNREYLVSINDVDAIRLLGYSVEDKNGGTTAIFTDESIYTRIRTISSEKCHETVYNISTYDETYVCFNTLVRNSGKDRFSMMTGIKYFVECLNENRIIDEPDMVPPVLWWIVAPTEKMAKQNWRELKQFFPKEWVVACSDSNFQMETIGGGIIEVRSGYSSADLVGVGLDCLVLTEAARFQDLEVAWANLEARLNSPGRGRKIDRAGHRYGQGKAILNSSPLGRNAFFDIWCYGQKDHPNYSSIWWSTQLPWTCNPINKELAESIVHTKYGDITYEESLRRQLGERTFRSNYLADFLAEDSAVFKKFEENCVINPFSGEMKMSAADRRKFIEEWKSVSPFGNYVCGYDPATGSSGDSPALVVRCLDDNRVVRVFDMYGKNYEQQWDFIGKISAQYNHAPVHWLRTGHTAVEGQLSKRGCEEIPIDEQAQNKGRLVQTLELAVENGDLKVLNDGSSEISTLIYQMNDYAEKNGRYSNAKQPHDDFVSALYAAFSNYSVEEVIIEYSNLMSGVLRQEDFE